LFKMDESPCFISVSSYSPHFHDLMGLSLDVQAH